MIENNYFLENQDLQENFQFIIDWKEIIDGFEDDFADHKIFQKTEMNPYRWLPVPMTKH